MSPSIGSRRTFGEVGMPPLKRRVLDDEVHERPVKVDNAPKSLSATRSPKCRMGAGTGPNLTAVYLGAVYLGTVRIVLSPVDWFARGFYPVALAHVRC